MTGGDTAQIKRINTNLIRRTMLAGNAWTKDMLAAQTGLSTATCRKILMEMLESCEVTELSPADPKGGRPARRFRYNRDFVMFLLVRLDNTQEAQSAAVSLVDSGGTVHRTAFFTAERLAPAFLLDSLAGFLKNVRSIENITVSYPGVVHNGKTVNWATIPILNGLELEAEMQRTFGVPVTVENDINLAAWGYASQLPPHEADIAYIGIPERSVPGCGLVIGGQLLKGARGFAGEVMYIENLTWEEQRERLRTKPHALPEMVWGMLRPITALLDPRQVVIAGDTFPQEERQYILKKCGRMFRREFLPQLVFREDHLTDNFAGLLDFARRQFYAVGNKS